MAQQILFQKNLVDVVRGLRNNKKSEKDYITRCLEDIKDELKSKEHSVKVMAVVKMAYFNMLGYSVEYGAFNVIEVMSDTNFNYKRIGYAAAAAGFHHDTSVLPLVTNLLKRDILSSQQYEAGMGLYCLSCICTPDLAKDLVSDVASLLTSQRAYVRKKTVLCLYKLIIQYPEALRPIFPRLKEKLEDGNEKSDNDPSVRGAVVNVLCELARRNPANYLGLAVTFFSLLSTVHNNWTLIKIVKLFGVWAPLEPRLGKKLVDPLTNLINTTPAKSVQYECVYTVASGMCKQSAITKLAVDKMKQFAQDYDQNLKYLGLEAMCLLMKENPKVLADQRDIVLSCVEDPDVTIRMKALQLMRGMSTKKTLQPTISKLFEHIIRNPPEDSWSNAVIKCVVDTVSDNDYMNCTDFEWYIKVLVDLVDTQITNFAHGALIANEFQVIVTRVEGVRQYAIDSLCSVLLKPQLLACDVDRSTQWLVLKAAAFLLGEYPQYIPNKRFAIESLLDTRIGLLPSELQVMCVAAVGKIQLFSTRPCARHKLSEEEEADEDRIVDKTTSQDLLDLLQNPADGKKSSLLPFTQSSYPEVQERALLVQRIAESETQAGLEVLYAAELEPIAEGAQQSVKFPEDLDLDTPFCENLPQIRDDSEEETEEELSTDTEDEETVARRQKYRRDEKVSAFYIGDLGARRHDDEDLPPVVKLDAATVGMPLRVSAKKKVHEMKRDYAKPANYVAPKARQGSPEPVDEIARRLQHVNVSSPIKEGEELPAPQPYIRFDPSASPSRDAAGGVTPERSVQRKRIAETDFLPVTILSDKHCTVSLQPLECKLKKDVMTLFTTVTVANKSSSHSLYDVTVVTENPAALTLPNGTDNEVRVGARIKGGASAKDDVNIGFVAPPQFNEPVKLTLRYKRDKKECLLEMSLPLKVQYFLKAPEPVSSEEFMAKLQGLEGRPASSEALRLPKEMAPMDVINIAKSVMRLCIVDVYKDCVTLMGQLVVKKTMPATLAVVVRSKKDKMTLMVKCISPAMSAVATQEVVAALKAIEESLKTPEKAEE